MPARKKRRGYAPGWWTSFHADADHKRPGWDWFILPWLSFTPWHPSTLASLPGFAGVSTCSIEWGWLWWRCRFTIGYTTRLDQGEPDGD